MVSSWPLIKTNKLNHNCVLKIDELKVPMYYWLHNCRDNFFSLWIMTLSNNVNNNGLKTN
jgi:hypothetical protein